MKGFSSKSIALKVDVTQGQKIDCFAGMSVHIQPGNVTGWDSEGVNEELFPVRYWRGPRSQEAGESGRL